MTLGQPGLRQVDPTALDAAELDAYNARYGKLDLILFNKLATLAPTDLVPVSIWLKQAPTNPVVRPVPHTDPRAKSSTLS